MNPEIWARIQAALGQFRQAAIGSTDKFTQPYADFGQGQGQFGMDMVHNINAIAHSTNANPAPKNAGLSTILGIGSMLIPGMEGEGGALERGVASSAERGAAERAAVKAVAGHEPNADIGAVAQKYLADNKIDTRPMPRPEKVDPAKGKLMADAYENLKSDPNDPAVRSAYTKFGQEVKAQHDALINAGYKFDYSPHDPYPNSAAMLKDLRDNKTIKVFKTAEGQEHPLMSNEDNDMFRAIHDAFGHGINGNQFGPRGEEGAFRDHSAMFSPEARRVMATETRGQNSWVNFGPKSDVPMKERPYAVQKAALWPEHLMGDYHEMPAASPPADRLRAQATPSEQNTYADIVQNKWPTAWDKLGKTVDQAHAEPGIRRSELSAALKNPDMIAPRIKAPWIIRPEQADIERYTGNPRNTQAVEDMANQTYRGPDFMRWLQKGAGGGRWYNDNPKIIQMAQDALGDEEGHNAFKDMMSHMSASTAMSRPDNNLRRASWWRALNLSGQLDPAVLRSRTLAAPPGMGHIAQIAHHSAVADLVEDGVLNHLDNPKPASFYQNQILNGKPYTNDTRMATATLDANPKMSLGIAGKPGDGTPRDWAYSPMEKAAQSAASEAHTKGLLDPVPDGTSPTSTWQAQIWNGIGQEGSRSMGLKPSKFEGNFSDVFNKLLSRSAKLWGVSPTEANRLIWQGHPFDLPLNSDLLTGKPRLRKP